MPIILIEGADGTGKTTLAHILCDEFGYNYLKFVVPDEHPIDYWYRQLKSLSHRPYPTVVDRLHLSEEAYGPVFRGQSGLSELDFWILEGWLTARQTIVIMCSASWETMQVNQAKAHGEYHGDRQLEVVENFRRLTEKTQLPLIHYDYSSPQLIHEAHSAVESQYLGRFHCNAFGIGTFGSPKIWIVGERPAKLVPDREFKYETPFYSTSGDYLRLAIGAAGLLWKDIYISNAYSRQGSVEPLMAQWKALINPAVVALGNVADIALTEAKIPHNTVAHPQYWRRFHHSQLGEYAHAIKTAAGC